MDTSELNLRLIYGVRASSADLVVLGKVSVNDNAVRLLFADGSLGQLTAGLVRPFILLSRPINNWPELPPDLAERPLETKIWANPRGKLKDHRSQVWAGWPLRPDLVLLKPLVPPTKLDTYESKQDGFVLSLRDSDGNILDLTADVEPRAVVEETGKGSEHDQSDAGAAGVGAEGGPAAEGTGGSTAAAESGAEAAPRGGLGGGNDSEREPLLPPSTSPVHDGAGEPRIAMMGTVPFDVAMDAMAGDPGALEEAKTHMKPVDGPPESGPDDDLIEIRFATWGEQVEWIRVEVERGEKHEDLAYRLQISVAHIYAACGPQSWERKGGYVDTPCSTCQEPIGLTDTGYPMCPNKHVHGALCDDCGLMMQAVGWEPVDEYGNPPRPILECDQCVEHKASPYGPSDLLVAEPFCGAGGLGLGLSRAGFGTAWAGEKDKHAIATFGKAFKTRILVEAVLDGSEDFVIEEGRLDLLAGGPPCQPFSNAGAKKGQWDERDGFPVFLQYVQRYQPRAILIENVKGILAKRHEDYFATIINSLERHGYFVCWDVLQAADYGVPQRRERVFIMGFREEADFARFKWPRPTHSLEALVWHKYAVMGDQEEPRHDPESATRYEKAVYNLLWKYQDQAPTKGSKVHAKWEAMVAAQKLLPWVTVREALGDLVREFEPGATLHTPPDRVPACEIEDVELVDVGRGGEAGEKGTTREKSLLYKKTRPDVPADTVSAAAEQKGSEHCARVALVVKSGPHFSPKDHSVDGVAPTITASMSKGADVPQVTLRRSNGPERTTVERGIDAPATTMTAQNIPQLVVRNLGAGDGLGARPDDVAPTVPADAAGQTGLAAMDGASVHEWEGGEDSTEPGRVHRRPKVILRRLSHTEVARLQGFPDDWPWQGPSTAIYRQIGNAVPPPLAEALGRSIRRAIQKKKPRSLV